MTGDPHQLLKKINPKKEKVASQLELNNHQNTEIKLDSELHNIHLEEKDFPPLNQKQESLPKQKNNFINFNEEIRKSNQNLNKPGDYKGVVKSLEFKTTLSGAKLIEIVYYILNKNGHYEFINDSIWLPDNFEKTDLTPNQKIRRRIVLNKISSFFYEVKYQEPKENVTKYLSDNLNQWFKTDSNINLTSYVKNVEGLVIIRHDKYIKEGIQRISEKITFISKK